MSIETKKMSERELNGLIDTLTFTETTSNEMESVGDDDWSKFLDVKLYSLILRDKECPDVQNVSEGSTIANEDCDDKLSNTIEELLIPVAEYPPVKICQRCFGLIPLPILLAKIDDVGDQMLQALSSSFSAVKQLAKPSCSCKPRPTKNASRKGMKYKTTKEKGAAKAKPAKKKDKTDSSSSSRKTVKGTIRLFFTSIIDFFVSHEQC